MAVSRESKISRLNEELENTKKELGDHKKLMEKEEKPESGTEHCTNKCQYHDWFYDLKIDYRAT